MSRVAWFSPVPPLPTGIARYSADLISRLGRDHEIDVFMDQRNLVGLGKLEGCRSAGSAHDFIWRNQKAPYDLIVYQLGNSSYHDYQWPYLFRYPGLAVLHDAHLHHARAACLLRTRRADDYRAEFVSNHPDANPDLAELAAAGFDNHLHYSWPMTRLVVRSARMVAVHTRASADRLREENPGARIATVRIGHGVDLPAGAATRMSRELRGRYRIPAQAVVIGCFGGLTPDKRIAEAIAAFAAVRPALPDGHLLLAGALPDGSNVPTLIAEYGLDDCTTITGYLPTDDELTACIAAADVALCLRWPTAREVSGPWLRCLAAGRATVTTDLAHLADVPSLDPRTWRPTSARGSAPCAVAIDITDEAHSLRVALRRLGSDEVLRRSLGAAAQEYWRAHHDQALMAADYGQLFADAIQQQGVAPALPRHLTDHADATLRDVITTFRVPIPFAL